MLNYKLEELRFLNMRKISVYKDSPRLRNGLSVFEIEKTLSEAEKLSIIDDMKEGIGSYILNIIKKWEDEIDSLPRDMYGNPKTVSKKAWIKRSDKKNIISTSYNVGRYSLLKETHSDLSLECLTTDNGYSMEYTGESIVHQWFHSLCKELYQDESLYFQNNDPKQIKLKKVREYGNYLSTTFDSETLNDIIWNNKEDVEEAFLDQVISMYEELEEKIKELSLKLKEDKNSIVSECKKETNWRNGK